MALHAERIVHAGNEVRQFLFRGLLCDELCAGSIVYMTSFEIQNRITRNVDAFFI